jgi:hypothetical protein
MSTKNQQDKIKGSSQMDEHHAASLRLDTILASEEALIPSSGFLAAVLGRVGDETPMPEPIPFPWKRALPGFVLATAAAGWGAVEFVRLGIPAIKAGVQAELTAPAVHLPVLHGAASSSAPIEQAGWVAMALGISAASSLMARLLVRRSHSF